MAATAPPEDSLSSGPSGYQVRPRSFPQPLHGYPQQQQMMGYPQQQGFPVSSGGYPLQPYPTQLGPQRVFYEPMVRASLQTLHVDCPPPYEPADGQLAPPVQRVAPPTEGRRVAPPYEPPPPYPLYGATHPAPAQPTTTAPSRPPPQTSPSNNLCLKFVKTLVMLATISFIASVCYYFFYLKRKH